MYSRTTVKMVGVGETSIKCSASSFLSAKFNIPGPDVLKLFSCLAEHEISTAHKN